MKAVMLRSGASNFVPGIISVSRVVASHQSPRSSWGVLLAEKVYGIVWLRINVTESGVVTPI